MSEQSSSSWSDRLLGGFRKTSDRLSENIAPVSQTRGNTRLDDATLDEIEDALIMSDLGPEAAGRVREALREQRFGAEITERQLREAVAEEIAAILRPVAKPLEVTAFPRPQVILVIGVNGSGKTTTIAKLAHLFMEDDYEVMLAAGDTFRAAAIGQLQTWADRVGVPLVRGPEGGDPASIVFDAVKRGTDEGTDALIVDTAGRLQIDDALMEELGEIRDAVQPTEILLVADAMTGQEAVKIAQGFDEALGITGIVMTKMDGDARGGAALSIRGVTGRPIKFIGVGEGMDDLDTADPERLAGRILQMGDVIGLVERAQVAFDQGEQEKLQEQVLGRGRFTLEDFLVAMRQVQKMGPLDQLMKLIPGAARMKIPAGNLDPKRFKHVEAIILSMTPLERRKPELLDRSRRARIAKGSGRPVSEVNRLMKQFKEMQKFMKQMKGMMGGGGMPMPPSPSH